MHPTIRAIQDAIRFERLAIAAHNARLAAGRRLSKAMPHAPLDLGGARVALREALTSGRISGQEAARREVELNRREDARATLNRRR